MSWSVCTDVSRTLGVTPVRRAAALSGFVASAVMAVQPMAQALDTQAINAKFSEILVLTPVNTTGQPIPVDGIGMVALFSSQAASDFDQRLRQRQRANQSPGAQQRYALTRLTDFEEAFRQRQKTNPNLSKVYGPDPTDAAAASGLLQQQGVAVEQANAMAAREPFIFCPDPLIRLTNQGSQGQPATRVICSVSFVPVALLVNKSTPILKKPAIVRVYSLAQMYTFLQSQSSDDAQNLVMTSPLETLLNGARQSQPSTAPSTVKPNRQTQDSKAAGMQRPTQAAPAPDQQAPTKNSVEQDSLAPKPLSR